MSEVIITPSAAEKRLLGNCGCRDCYCPGTIVEDGFSGSNGASVTGRTPDTQNIQTTWATPGGTWAIQGNKCRESGTPDAGGVHFQAPIECYQSGTTTHPVTITCDITVPTGTNSISPGLTFRYSGSSDHWLLTPDVTIGNLYLVELSGGVSTIRDADTISLSAGTYAASVVLNGTSITGTYNGVVLTATSSVNLTNTKHGLDNFFDQLNSAGTFSEWDNFKVVCT